MTTIAADVPYGLNVDMYLAICELPPPAPPVLVTSYATGLAWNESPPAVAT